MRGKEVPVVQSQDSQDFLKKFIKKEREASISWDYITFYMHYEKQSLNLQGSAPYH